MPTLRNVHTRNLLLPFQYEFWKRPRTSLKRIVAPSFNNVILLPLISIRWASNGCGKAWRISWKRGRGGGAKFLGLRGFRPRILIKRRDGGGARHGGSTRTISEARGGCTFIYIYVCVYMYIIRAFTFVCGWSSSQPTLPPSAPPFSRSANTSRNHRFYGPPSTFNEGTLRGGIFVLNRVLYPAPSIIFA